MRVEVPGKIYIAGEYGVVHGGHAILAPSARKMIFTIREATSPMIHSMKYAQTFNMEASQGMPRPIHKAYAITTKYLATKNIPVKGFYLTIDSQLDSGNQKLGLGSSAATTVGIIKSLLKYHNVVFDEITLYKLAVLSDIKDTKKTSYGDVALCVVNAWLLYKKFDVTWLKRRLNMPIDQLVSCAWKDLLIQPMQSQTPNILVINTMKRAHSKPLVERFNKGIPLKVRDQAIQNINDLSVRLYHKIQHNEQPLCEEIEALDQLYADLAQDYLLSFYTDAMTKIRIIVKQYGGCMKFSGAGGGDNVLGVFDSHDALIRAKEALHEKGYMIVDDLGSD